MSWWTDVRDKYTKIASAGFYDREGRLIERDQRNLANEQMKAYRDQTELAKKQLDEARAATTAEKRRVNEKQIRSLRRSSSFSGAGLLGIGQPASDDMNKKLGA